MAGLVCYFGAKAFLMSAIVMAKIIYLGFLARCTSGVTLIIWIFRVSGKLWLSTVSYIGFSSVSALGTGLVLNLGSLSIFFIIKYQFFLYFCMVSLSFCLALGGIMFRVDLWGLAGILGS